MNMMFFLLPLALCLSALFLWFFIRSVHQGQFDHLDEDQLIPLSEEPPTHSESSSQK
jgi:cbb3-type cytochrome oxidase maturation protein